MLKFIVIQSFSGRLVPMEQRGRGPFVLRRPVLIMAVVVVRLTAVDKSSKCGFIRVGRSSSRAVHRLNTFKPETL